MDRKSALVQLQERFVQTKDILRQEFQQQVCQHYEELIQKLYQGIGELDKQYPIRVVQFQMMRPDIYSGKCCIRVCGYDENWYSDELRTETEVEADYLFEPFQNLMDTLSKEISVYMGGVTEYDIRNLVCEFFIQCFCDMAGIIRERFFLFDEWAEENDIHWQLPYRIVWGEYAGRAETLFYLDRLGKQTEDFRKECPEAKERRKEANLFTSFVQSEVSETEVREANFAYLNMKKSRLSQVALTGCTLGQSMFQQSVMEWCSFRESKMYGCNFNNVEGYQTDFQGTRLTNCCFDKAKLRKARFEDAVLEDISFSEGVLEECSFQNARLHNVDLRACKLEGIDFTGAELEQVYIHSSDVASLHLTEEQSRHVYVLKEEAHAVL